MMQKSTLRLLNKHTTASTYFSFFPHSQAQNRDRDFSFFQHNNVFSDEVIFDATVDDYLTDNNENTSKLL